MDHHHIAIIGGTTFDHIVYLPQFPAPLPTTIHQAAFAEGIGSTGSGKALALTRLGMPNTLYSVVGDDAYGARIKAYLQQQGVHAFFDTDPAGTERHINLMNEQGERISIFITQSSERIPHTLAPIRELLVRASVVALNIISYCRHLLPLIRECGKPVWTDLHDYTDGNPYHKDFIDAAQYIHLSSDNLPNYREVMERFITEGKELVVCTHGRKGASLLTRSGEWLEQEAVAGMPVVDSNGAGDSFFSGFLYAFLHGKPLQECLQWGAVCGAYAVTNHSLVYEGLTPQFVARKAAELYPSLQDL